MDRQTAATLRECRKGIVPPAIWAVAGLSRVGYGLSILWMNMIPASRIASRLLGLASFAIAGAAFAQVTTPRQDGGSTTPPVTADAGPNVLNLSATFGSDPA